MNILNILSALRKLWYFLVGLFPILSIAAEQIGRQLQKHLGKTTIGKKIYALKHSAKGKAVSDVIERFYWRDFKPDQLDLALLPAECLVVLRPVFLISVILCFLLPFSGLKIGAQLPIQTDGGIAGTTSGYTIWIRLVACALGWGCLLGGAINSNRVFFAIVAYIYIMLFGACAFYLPRSSWNASLPLTAFLACGLSENALARPTTWNLLSGVAASMVVGAFAGIYLIALTPLQPLCKPNVIPIGIIAGCILSLLPVCYARMTMTNRAKRPGVETAEELTTVVPIGTSVWAFSLCNAAFMLSLISRSNLGAFGEKLLSLLLLWNSYIWPVWYFIGVGIIFKFLKSTKLVVSAAREISNQNTFVPMTLMLLVAAACICWSDPLSTLPAVGITQLPHFFFKTIHDGLQFYWAKQINQLAAGEMKWVLLFDLFAVSWLAIKRRLDNDACAFLSYLSLLAWFLIVEFLVEELGFLRPPGHDIVAVTIFGIWIIWMFHTMGLKASLTSTPRWPTNARLSIYGSIMLFSLVQLYGRSCIRDFSSMNVIYLTLYRGLLDVGLPYFFYVYATRRFKQLPISTLAIFALFCCGAGLALPMNVLDKFALSNFSLPAFQAMWDRQYHLFVEQGIAFLPDFRFSAGWILAKACMTIGALVVLATLILRRTARHRDVYAALIFSLMAFVSGFASFSKAQFDLPIPPKFLILITPVFVAMKLDATTLEPYLAYWLPALSLALSLSWRSRSWAFRWTVGVISAFVLHWSITAAWPNQKDWLISTGTFTTLELALLSTLAYLVYVGIQFVERGLVAEINPEEANQATQTSPALQTDPATQTDPAMETSPATPTDPAIQASPATPADPAIQTSPASPINPAERDTTREENKSAETDSTQTTDALPVVTFREASIVYALIGIVCLVVAFFQIQNGVP